MGNRQSRKTPVYVRKIRRHRAYNTGTVFLCFGSGKNLRHLTNQFLRAEGKRGGLNFNQRRRFRTGRHSRHQIVETVNTVSRKSLAAKRGQLLEGGFTHLHISVEKIGGVVVVMNDGYVVGGQRYVNLRSIVAILSSANSCLD